MRWSWRVGSVSGIRVQVHWTFLILIGWVVLQDVSRGADVTGVIRGVALVAAVFGCVVLHELGHALTARCYGIATRDITLLPIGGVPSAHDAYALAAPGNTQPGWRSGQRIPSREFRGSGCRSVRQ